MRAAHRGIDLEATGRGASPGERLPCPMCQGAIGRACGQCKGGGWIRVGKEKEAKADDGMPAELVETVGGLVNAWSWIEHDGMDGFVEMDRRITGRRRRLDEEFPRWLVSLRGELNRLEFEDDVAEALKDAKARK